MNKIHTIKDFLKTDLPKCFKVSASKTGLTVFVRVKAEDFPRDQALAIVSRAAKKNNLKEINHGILFPSGDMDWEFVNKTVEKQLVEDADILMKRCKNFFKTWNGNEYCNSDMAYDRIARIRAMFETDEN